MERYRNEITGYFRNNQLQYCITSFIVVPDPQKYIFLKSPRRELSKNIYFYGLEIILKKVMHESCTPCALVILVIFYNEIQIASDQKNK